MPNDGSNWVGTTLANRYTVEEILGAGGMGTALRASDSNLQTDVVVKVPHRNMLKDEEFVKRFSQEVRSLVTLSHPHVVSVLDVGEHDGVPFAVMRYLPGGDLKDRCPRDADGKRTPQDPARLADWLDDVAKALDFIHAQGYVHRDIKPDNILFDNVQNAYVGDFGIIKAFGDGPDQDQTKSLTQEGVALGTPEYMAPEVVMGEKYDGRADQYALAATVYEMLCCRPPFRGKTPAAIIVKSTTEKAPDPCELVPSISRKLGDCILKGLSRNPEERFPDCISFASEVLRLVRSEDRATIRTHVAGTGESADPDQPTDQYPGSGNQPALATPPPLSTRKSDAECPGCGHRFRATSDTVLTCPECSHSFPAAGESKSTPPLPERDTDRQPTNTLKQSPPPIPTQSSKKSPAKDDKNKPAQGKERKPTGKNGNAAHPDKPQAATPGEPSSKTKTPSSKKKPKPRSKPPKKVERTPTVIEPLADNEPPTVQPGMFAQPPPQPEKNLVAAAPSVKPKPEPKVAAKPRPKPVQPNPRESGSGTFKLVAFIIATLLMIGGGIWVIIWLVGKSEQPSDEPDRQKTIIVAEDGSGDHKTIGEAVAVAAPNTRILVKPGSYSESDLTLASDITIEGEERDNVTIFVKTPIQLKADGARLKSLSVRISGDHKMGRIGPGPNVKDLTTSIHIPNIADRRCLVRVTNGSPTIENCNLMISDGTAVVVDGKSAKPKIVECRVRRCGMVGVQFINQASGTVERCLFEHNHAAAVLVTDGSPTLNTCQFIGNQHIGVAVAKGSATLDNCSFDKVKRNDAISKTNTLRRKTSTGQMSNVDLFPSAAVLGARGTDLTVRNSKITGSSDWGVRTDGKLTIEKSGITGTGHRGLQLDTNADAVIRGTKVIGSRSRGVLVFGKATIDQQCDFSGGKLNVLYIDKSATVKISDITVRDGGSIGILCYTKASMSNVTVKNNTSSGIHVREGINVTLTNCRITDGKSYGVRTEGNLTLYGCTIQGNTSDAIRIEDDGNAHVRSKSKLIQNKGRGIYCEGKLTVDDCEITGNSSSGIAVYGGTARISNSRIRTSSAYAVYVTTQKVTTKSKTTRTEPSFVSIKNCTLRGSKSPTYKASGCTLIIDGKIAQ